MKITLEEVKKMDKELLLPDEAARVLGMDPNVIRESARKNPEGLGFPVIVCGGKNGTTCVRIPRRAFIAYLEGKGK